MAVGAEEIEDRLDKAEREVYEYKREAQILTDQYTARYDIIHNAAGGKKQAETERCNLEQEILVAEADLLMSEARSRPPKLRMLVVAWK